MVTYPQDQQNKLMETVKNSNQMPVFREPIRLVVLLQDLEFGGTQRYAIHLLTRLDRSLFDPELWVLRGGEDMIPHAETAGLPIRHMSGTSWVGPHSLANLAFHLHTRRPQILYTLTVVPNIWGRLFGRLVRVPVIVSGYRNLLPKQHERFLWRLSDRIICNAHVLQDIMVRRHSVDAARIAVIHNGIDPGWFSPNGTMPQPERRVLFVGRLVWEKDPVNLLEAFRLVAERLPEARFEIVGKGPMGIELDEGIRRYGLESSVTIVPGSEDIRENMGRASVFTLSSADEACPNVILEAMAMGLPVVATRVGGIPELVDDGKTGILVPPRNPADLADALTSVLADPAKARQMGLMGRERVVSLFDVDSMVRKTEQVLLDAHADGQRRAAVPKA
ncbi:MAG: glycosyltransferase family 4 protein [Thermodesulfobacteriota bacterium]